MLSYQALKYFTVVARCGSVTRAAESLYLSQSGLSVHIRNLEQELGVALFRRTNRSVELTPAGKALYEWSAPFFDGEEQAIRTVRRAASGGSGRIDIGTVGANITYSLSGLIQSFRQQYPHIQVVTRRMNVDPLNDALDKGQVDLAFQFLFAAEVLPGFAHHVLERGQMVLAVHKDSPLARLPEIGYEDLRGVPLACLTPSSAAVTRQSLFSKCAAHGFTPDIVAEMDYVEPLLTMVNMGSCATITSDLAPLNGLENVCYVPLAEHSAITLAMVWRKEGRSPAAQLFIRHIIDAMP